MLTSLLTKLGSVESAKAVWVVDSEGFNDKANISISINTQFYGYQQEHAGGFVIKEMYRIGQDSLLTVKDLGNWRREFGLNISEIPIWERRNNLHEMAFSAATVHV